MSLTSLAIAFLVAWGLTGITLALARRYHVVDAPNLRSSHALPTPTLGGCAILGATLIGAWCGGAQGLSSLVAASLLLLFFVVDDLCRPLGVTIKAGVQLLSATVWVVMSHFSVIHLPVIGLIGGLGVSILAVLWLVAWMNAFNFM
ncbi:MAG: UDP-N-acetylmuramyl pentapeptide phosphotransferase, partial [Gemmatimonadetes bacterium]|nr:UDP-N-acetylmuramyl pentapeptide phosphotransferase [Gemmatimonadota bacterium]